jgi:hypothetical protein
MTAQLPERPPAEIRLNSAQVRTLAHPLRSRLLGTLRIEGPATATTLARILGTNTGATSYHLRQLAEVGLVVEDIERGTARQRWWRAAHQMHQYVISDFEGDPDGAAAANWLSGEHVRLFAQAAEKWDAARSSFPPAWRDAAIRNDYLVTLAPDRLRALEIELNDVILRYRTEVPAPEADARDVYVFVSAHPFIRELS